MLLTVKGDEMRTSGWMHSPLHMLKYKGIYMVTGATYLKEHYFRESSRTQFLHDTLIAMSTANGWELHAWAVFSNHYHFVAASPNDPSNLSKWIAVLHHTTATYVNALDNTLNRKVWFQYWDTRLTIQSSYLARLNYVHRNAVKHKLVLEASDYPWCSASKFERDAPRSFVNSVYRFDYDKVKVFDEF